MIGTIGATFESNITRNYNFTDSIPEPGLNYYRLKMVDADGSFAFSMKQYPLGMYYIHFEQADGAVKIFKLMHN